VFKQPGVFVLTENAATLAASFVQTLNKSASKTLQMLTEAYCPDATKKLSVHEWHKRFKEGQEDMKNDERTGWPTNTAK
jgi:hypothetical protein